MANHGKTMYTHRIDIVNGNIRHIERILEFKGFSQATIDDIMEKIESIIEHSGWLGRIIQKDLDYKYIEKLKAKKNTEK